MLSLTLLIELPNLLLTVKERSLRAFDLYTWTTNFLFDRDFYRVPGVSRVEPS